MKTSTEKLDSDKLVKSVKEISEIIKKAFNEKDLKELRRELDGNNKI